jgi:hypothetical protein
LVKNVGYLRAGKETRNKKIMAGSTGIYSDFSKDNQDFR